MGPDAPTVTNENGGKQSDLPYRFDLLDGKALAHVAHILHQGAEKYGEDNWRLIDVNPHLNHVLSHIFAYLSGDTTDDHLGHAACRMQFALAVSLQGGPLSGA